MSRAGSILNRQRCELPVVLDCSRLQPHNKQGSGHQLWFHPPRHDRPHGTGSNQLFFFFQAEDGIRDSSVTGTCALPIYHTALTVKKNRNGRTDWCTDDDIVDLVRALARHMPDQTIAAVLNRLGKSTSHGHSWTRGS